MKACYVLLPLMLTALMIRPAPGQTPYKLPPKDVVAILDAPLPPIADREPDTRQHAAGRCPALPFDRGAGRAGAAAGGSADQPASRLLAT